MNNTEVWVVVNNYPNYEVSNWGRVKNKITNQLIKGWPNKNNHYWQVMLYNENGNRLFNLHRLVAEHFLERPNTDMDVVGHIDNDRTNNNVSNLFWKYSRRSRNTEEGISDDSRSNRKSPFRYVIKQYTQLGFCVAMFLNWDDLKKLGYNRTSILQASNGKYNTKNPKVYKGYLWGIEKYKNND